MSFVRRYIQPPRWHGNGYVEHNRNFLKELNSLCLDAGLVKSNVVDGLDIDNIDFSGIDIEATNAQYLKTLWFDVVDTMQSELPISIGYMLGKAKYNAGNFGVFVIMYTYIKIGKVTTSFGNSVSSYGSRLNTGWVNPYVFNNESDSFIVHKDGFFSSNICNGFGESGSTSDYSNSTVLSSVTIERSFDTNGIYTPENVNIFASPSNYNTTYEMRIYISDGIKTENVDGGMYYFNVNNSGGVYKNGKTALHSVYHILNDSSVVPSPNILAINKYAIDEAREIMVNINGEDAKFISLSGGDPVYHGTSSMRISSHNVYSGGAKIIVRV